MNTTIKLPEQQKLLKQIALQQQNPPASIPGLQERLRALKEVRTQVEERKQEIIRPLNEALKSARALFKPLEEALEKTDFFLRNQILELEVVRLKEQEKLAKKVEAGKISVDTAVALVEEQTSGLFRTVRKLKIVSKKDIPEKYWVLNEVALRADLMAGKKVRGAVLVEEKTVTAR